MIDSLAAPAHPSGAPPASKTLTRFVEQCPHQQAELPKQERGRWPRSCFGTPTMIRTWDPQIRNLVLYPTELPGRCEQRKFYQSPTSLFSHFFNRSSIILLPRNRPYEKQVNKAQEQNQ